MDKINKLLEEYKNIADKLNKINEAMNEIGTNSEDMMPGHDDGAEWWENMNKYKIYMAQAKNVKKQLNELGYNKV